MALVKDNTGNAIRFINCYNKIDSALRTQGDMKRSISYTEAVKRAARTNELVRKYEDDLIDYGRLRNAIVHNSDDNEVIAEPKTEVVENYERITNLICTPPLAIDTVCNKNFYKIEYNEKIADVMKLMYQNGVSNLPIYKNQMLIGVANANKLTKLMGKKIYEKVDINNYIIETTIEESLKEMMFDNYYTISDSKITLDKVLNLFTENRKLLIIIITKTGSLLESPIGIISVGDIMDINKILDNYV